MSTPPAWLSRPENLSDAQFNQLVSGATAPAKELLSKGALASPSFKGYTPAGSRPWNPTYDLPGYYGGGGTVSPTIPVYGYGVPVNPENPWADVRKWEDEYYKTTEGQQQLKDWSNMWERGITGSDLASFFPTENIPSDVNLSNMYRALTRTVGTGSPLEQYYTNVLGPELQRRKEREYKQASQVGQIVGTVAGAIPAVGGFVSPIATQLTTMAMLQAGGARVDWGGWIEQQLLDPALDLARGAGAMALQYADEQLGLGSYFDLLSPYLDTRQLLDVSSTGYVSLASRKKRRRAS